MSVETYVKETKNAFMEGCRGYESRGIFAVSIASLMSVLSFCSEKQNGWLVKGKTPVLLLLIDSWKCQHAKQIALPLRHQSSGRFGCKVCQQAMQFALPLRHQSSGRFGCKVCQQAMQFALPLRHQNSGRFGCKVCQHAMQFVLP